MTIEEARNLLRTSREKLHVLRGMFLQIEADILSLEHWLSEREQVEHALNAANAELAKRSKQEQQEWLNQALNEGDGTYNHDHHH